MSIPILLLAVYPQLSDITWTTEFSGKIKVSNSCYVDYYFKSQNWFKSKLELEAMMNSSTEYIISYSGNKKRADKCNFRSLQIYSIDIDTINSSKRFPELDVLKENENSEFLGLYDFTPEDLKTDSIMFSPHDYNVLSVIILHELSHYWYHNLNLSETSSLKSEEFAQLIENSNMETKYVIH